MTHENLSNGHKHRSGEGEGTGPQEHPAHEPPLMPWLREERMPLEVDRDPEHGEDRTDADRIHRPAEAIVRVPRSSNDVFHEIAPLHLVI